MNITTNIHERAILVSLRISTWSARKYDKKVTAAVNIQHGASSDAGRYNKHLLPGDAESYQALMKHLGAVRTKHYEQTLAWADEGTRLLPIKNHKQYRDFIEEAKTTTAELLEAFARDYPSLKAGARIRLNGMFDDKDYPETAEIRNRFVIQDEYSPVPEADFRVALPPETIALMSQQLESRVKRATETAMTDAWTRLYECVQHLHERLADPKAIFRDSLVENVRDVCNVLGRLNVANDRQLESMRAAALETLTKYTPDALRANDRTRGQVAQTAGELMTQIRGTRRIMVAIPKAA